MKKINSQLCSSLRLSSTGVGRQNTRVPQACLTSLRPTSIDHFDLVCDVEAEPLHRYRLGGYHPIHTGDVSDSGRYRILHKLGWGGYSTVWAARDERASENMAIKIAVSGLVFQACLKTLPTNIWIVPDSFYSTSQGLRSSISQKLRAVGTSKVYARQL
ncbi:hypothetical protein K431DRAFT_261796 [Polychaeton citri CBS 116435]|uniref:non-specific serine/threonine protein kinase n=1 Tax=Polychaeton citri CBS 116435 TaxID=1314669 RepID=A0A9P4QFI9_9PEZI|nr:hypothetical protein K431DRAFT_261796 [Polychaeton citri CBS 116435]